MTTIEGGVVQGSGPAVASTQEIMSTANEDEDMHSAEEDEETDDGEEGDQPADVEHASVQGDQVEGNDADDGGEDDGHEDGEEDEGDDDGGEFGEGEEGDDGWGDGVDGGSEKQEGDGSEATVSAGTDKPHGSGDYGEDASSRPDPGVDYGDFLQHQYNELLQRLREYKSRHGNCNVPRDYPSDPQLGAWVHEQRDRYRRGALPQERFDVLDREGFVWESQNDKIWREKYERLVAYKDKHGDCAVPGNYVSDPTLAVWVKYQRDAKRRGRLGPRQIQMLEEIGFQWELTLEKQWNDKFDKLKVYQQTYGDCNVPYNFSEDPALGMWVKYQRDAKRRGRIQKRYQELLDGIGFQWEPALDKQWNDRFQKLLKFRDQHGHADVPSTYKDQALYRWVCHQRDSFQKNKLSNGRINRLNSVGFHWSSVSWSGMYTKLLAYVEEHGDSNVPSHWPPDPALALWVQEQRAKYKKGRLQPEHHTKLQDVSFDFASNDASLLKRKQVDNLPGPETKAPKLEEALENGTPMFAMQGSVSPPQQNHKNYEYSEYLQAQWMKQLEKLELFKAANGHCEVPRDWPEDPTMNTWISEQRERYRKGVLPPNQVESLNNLGFQWRNQADVAWDEHYDRLVAYSKKYGNANIPQTFPEDQKLANWATYQRERIRKGKMPTERLEKLESMGFEWEPVQERQWNERYEKLCAFHAQNGHCSVPTIFPEDPQLPTWVKTQRERKRKNKLPDSYIQRLDKLGFVWEPSKMRRMQGDSDRGNQIDSETETEGEENFPRASSVPTASNGQPETAQGSDLASLPAIAATLKRASDALATRAEEYNEVCAQRIRLAEKLKMAHSLRAEAEQRSQAFEEKLAKQYDKVKSLERKLELMTSALDRAENQIMDMKSQAKEAVEERARLHAALANHSSNGNHSGGHGGSSSSRLCLSCRDRPASCVVMPCMHLLHCRPCLDRAQSIKRTCPGCGIPSVSVMEVQLDL